MKLSDLSISLVCLACAIVGCGPNPPVDDSSKQDAPPTLNKAVKWPEVVGFKRDEVHRFEDPRLGYSIAYDSPSGLAVTVYVYDGGVAAIPDGVSDVARNELAKATRDISEAMKRGMWKSVNGGDARETRIGSGPGAIAAVAASFRLGHSEGEALSDLYVTGRRGEFVKIRCTYPAERRAECERARTILLDELGMALGSQNPGQ